MPPKEDRLCLHHIPASKIFRFTSRIDMQNIFNRQNIEERYFDPTALKIRDIKQLGWIPIFNIRVEW